MLVEDGERSAARARRNRHLSGVTSKVRVQ